MSLTLSRVSYLGALRLSATYPRSVVQAAHSVALREHEAAHLAAVEQLEQVFDARLTLEQHKVAAATAATDDTRFAADEAAARLRETHAGVSLLADLRCMPCSRVLSISHRRAPVCSLPVSGGPFDGTCPQPRLCE